ncbi:hypothetical protein IAI18_09780 [Acetobacteraceae bacterium H6797]|nr:hypothetical protein [Acetobacteraceae bacterium H6797]
MGEALAQGAPKAPAAASPPAVVQPPSPPAVRPPADREAMVQNETGIAMRELYVMPSGSADPGPDRLGADTLPAGASLRIRLGRQRGCNFDFRAVLADGSTQERQRIDLCRVTRVVMGDPTAPVREFEIANDTDLSVRELYVFPPGSSERGPDRLGADMIGAGARFKLSLGRTRDCVVTVRAIYEDDSTEDRERVNICTQRVVGFGDASIPMRQVTVENGGTDTIRYLYAIPSTGQTGGETNWRGDRLGSDVIEAGQSFTMRIRSASCRIDVRATYGDDQAEEKRGVDICQTPRVRFDGSDIPRLPTREVVLLNRHDSEIEQLYVSPANESDWGPDRLDDEVLARGGRRSVTLQADCQVDIRIVFPNGSAEERRGINVCQLGTVTLRRGWTLSNQVEDGGPADPSAPPAQGSVRLRNAAGVPMVELYTPSASKSGEASPRGDDRLGATVLGAGEVLDLMPPEGGGCIVDLTAIFRDGQTATRPGFDLCAGTEVSLP